MWGYSGDDSYFQYHTGEDPLVVLPLAWVERQGAFCLHFHGRHIGVSISQSFAALLTRFVNFLNLTWNRLNHAPHLLGEFSPSCQTASFLAASPTFARTPAAAV